MKGKLEKFNATPIKPLLDQATATGCSDHEGVLWSCTGGVSTPN